MEVRLGLNLLVGDAIGLWDVPGSERDSNEAKLTTDCLFKLRLGAVGRDMRRKGRWVRRGCEERGEETEPLSESVEGNNNCDIAWMRDVEEAWASVWSVSSLRFAHLGADDYIRTRLPTKQRARRTFQIGLLSISISVPIRLSSE